MKWILIRRPGLLGTLVHIRQGLQLKTHEYLRTHWDSSIWHPRGREAGLHILTPALLHFLQLWPLPPSCASIFLSSHFIIFFGSSHILFLLSLISVVPQSSEAPCADEGMSTCFECASSCQQAATAWRRLRCGRWWGSWFFFCSNHSQRTIVWFDFLQPSRVFHISNVNNSPHKTHTHTFDQICTICLWREMNPLARVLLFNPTWCTWIDQIPALMEATTPILRQYYVPHVPYVVRIMKV